MKKFKEIESLEEAKKLTLKVWEALLVKVKEQYEKDGIVHRHYNMTVFKGEIIHDFKYGSMKKNCPLCQWQMKSIGNSNYFDCTIQQCKGCPIDFCMINGYDDYMTFAEVETFVAFLRLALSKKE